VFVCILPEKAISERTYTVLGGTLNPTYLVISLSDITAVFLFFVYFSGFF